MGHLWHSLGDAHGTASATLATGSISRSISVLNPLPSTRRSSSGGPWLCRVSPVVLGCCWQPDSGAAPVQAAARARHRSHTRHAPVSPGSLPPPPQLALGAAAKGWVWLWLPGTDESFLSPLSRQCQESPWGERMEHRGWDAGASLCAQWGWVGGLGIEVGFGEVP